MKKKDFFSLRKKDSVQIFVAIHDYVAKENDEISLEKGDRIEYLAPTDDTGWATGRDLKCGKIGLYPTNFVQVTTESSNKFDEFLNFLGLPKIFLDFYELFFIFLSLLNFLEHSRKLKQILKYKNSDFSYQIYFNT